MMRFGLYGRNVNPAQWVGLLAKALKPILNSHDSGMDATRRRASHEASSLPSHQGMSSEAGRPPLTPLEGEKKQRRKGRITVTLRIAGILLLLIAIATGYLWMSRMRFDQRMGRIWAELRKPEGTERFDPEMIFYLPNPARRYFRHAIQPGTSLAKSVILEMEGQMRLGPGSGKVPMTGREILATPRGFIWKARLEDNFQTLSGYDFYASRDGGMRWWLWGIIPVVKADGPDLIRSAAGRVAIEALWLPSALLPVNGDEGEPVDDWSARVRVRVDGETLVSTLYVSPEGRLERVEMMRWDPKGPDGAPGYVLWVANEISEERTFDGYTIPVRLRVTSKAGSPQENSFFEPVIVTADFR